MNCHFEAKRYGCIVFMSSRCLLSHRIQSRLQSKLITQTLGIRKSERLIGLKDSVLNSQIIRLLFSVVS